MVEIGRHLEDGRTGWPTHHTRIESKNKIKNKNRTEYVDEEDKDTSNNSHDLYFTNILNPYAATPT
jgi:hypothetical protein